MSTYCYTLRKPTKTIHTPEGPIKVPTFEFAYGNAGDRWFNDKVAAIRDRQLTAAQKAFDHHAGPITTEPCPNCPNGYRSYRYCSCRYGRRDVEREPILALDGEWLVRTRRSNYLDGYSMEEIHEEIIGKVIQLPNGRRVLTPMGKPIATIESVFA